jgi:hypothetical protein
LPLLPKKKKIEKVKKKSKKKKHAEEKGAKNQVSMMLYISACRLIIAE